jgi:hypothetical protein
MISIINHGYSYIYNSNFSYCKDIPRTISNDYIYIPICIYSLICMKIYSLFNISFSFFFLGRWYWGFEFRVSHLLGR